MHWKGCEWVDHVSSCLHILRQKLQLPNENASGLYEYILRDIVHVHL